MTIRNHLAECALWPETGVRLNHRRVGAIGRFSVQPDASERAGQAATIDLLGRACDALRSAGCEIAVGPLDGSTWARYRFVTAGSDDDAAGDEPPFFMEPENPLTWPGWWAASGFAPVATYRSTVVDDLSLRDARAPGVQARMKVGGVRIRTFDPVRAQEDLKAAYRLSLRAFRDAFLYAPLDEAAFLAQYQSVLPYVVPPLVLLAHRRDSHGDEELIGFLFTIPDLAQAQCGAAVDTVILKTIAVAPGRDLAGLGILLLNQAHETARVLGFRRAIHALMHDNNKSRRLSEANHSRILRRYALYGKAL